jgi:hypothetical protein
VLVENEGVGTSLSRMFQKVNDSSLENVVVLSREGGRAVGRAGGRGDMRGDKKR